MKKSNKVATLGFTALAMGLSALMSTGANADNLLTAGTFKVGMEVTYPPFESYENGKVVGFDPELSALLAEQMGAQAEFSDNKFTSLILGLSSNKFDAVISGMYITDERIKVADAIPYARTGASILALKGSDVQPQTEHDLCGVKVGLQQGTTWVKALHDLSDSYCVANGKQAIFVQEFPSAPEASQALLSRNVQAQIEIAGAAQIIVEKTRGRIEVTSPDLVYPQTLGIYVNKNNTALKMALENALATITANGSYPELLKKYSLVGPAQ